MINFFTKWSNHLRVLGGASLDIIFGAWNRRIPFHCPAHTRRIPLPRFVGLGPQRPQFQIPAVRENGPDLTARENRPDPTRPCHIFHVFIWFLKVFEGLSGVGLRNETICERVEVKTLEIVRCVGLIVIGFYWTKYNMGWFLHYFLYHGKFRWRILRHCVSWTIRL